MPPRGGLEVERSSYADTAGAERPDLCLRSGLAVATTVMPLSSIVAVPRRKSVQRHPLSLGTESLVNLSDHEPEREWVTSAKALVCQGVDTTVRLLTTVRSPRLAGKGVIGRDSRIAVGAEASTERPASLPDVQR